jgi:hypothetical protein
VFSTERYKLEEKIKEKRKGMKEKKMEDRNRSRPFYSCFK